MIRSNRFRELARMMLQQARLLKSAGLSGEARQLARRAIAFKDYGQTATVLQPVRVQTHSIR